MIGPYPPLGPRDPGCMLLLRGHPNPLVLANTTDEVLTALSEDRPWVSLLQPNGGRALVRRKSVDVILTS